MEYPHTVNSAVLPRLAPTHRIPRRSAAGKIRSIKKAKKSKKNVEDFATRKEKKEGINFHK